MLLLPEVHCGIPTRRFFVTEIDVFNYAGLAHLLVVMMVVVVVDVVARGVALEVLRDVVVVGAGLVQVATDLPTHVFLYLLEVSHHRATVLA